MIVVRKLQDSDVKFVKAITLADEQVKFSSSAENFLTSGNSTTHLHVITLDNQIVGFFKLDTAYADSYSFCPKNAIGLRSFAVDKNQQGKGIGTNAVKALFPYISNYYSHFKFIYLTVNCKNPSAKACYVKGGFETLQELYLGGTQGPQHIMLGSV